MSEKKESFFIDHQTSIVIYGASYIGSVTGKALIENDYRVEAFVDLRAKEIGICLGRPVYTIEELGEHFENNIVIFVAVKNVYYHIDIASELNQYGYSNVIYKTQQVLSGKASKSEEKLDCAYERMVKKGDVPDQEIPIVLARKQLEWRGVKVLEDGNESVVVDMPTELIFTGATDRLWTNVSVLQLVPYISMFRWLDGDAGEDMNEYLKLCEKGAKNENLQITDEWKKYVIKNREDVYINMKWKYEYTPEFFVQQAPNVELNLNGKFVLKTGKHRASFLVAIGRTSIPVRIQKKIWDTYIEDSQIENVKKILKENRYPVVAIPHPYFQQNYEFNSISNQRSLCQLLKKMYDMDLLVGNKKNIDGILDLTASHGYFARYFYSIGMRVCMNNHVEYVDQAINGLFGVKITDRNDVLGGCSIVIADDFDCITDDIKQRAKGVFVIRLNNIQYMPFFC